MKISLFGLVGLGRLYIADENQKFNFITLLQKFGMQGSNIRFQKGKCEKMLESNHLTSLVLLDHCLFTFNCLFTSESFVIIGCRAGTATRQIKP